MKKNKKILIIYSSIIFFALFLLIIKKENIIIKFKKEVINDYPIIITKENKNNEMDVASINNNIIGSIKINGTNINYPIVQGNDNKYYLNHSTNNKKDEKGSIFLDYRNNLKDRKLLIYGHNSKTLKTALFHDLEKYIDYSFYKNHKYINLYLNDLKNEYAIFSVMIIKGNKHTKINFNDKEFLEHIDWMNNESIYDTGINVNMTDQILTLQTCYYKPANSFLLINAKKIK